jgi:hypothetical protein
MKQVFVSLSVIALWIPSHHARAAQYYVDNSAAGASNTNPGTETQPWTHCPGMPGWNGTLSLQPGDVVYFANDGTWEAADGNAVLQIAGGVTYDGSTWGSGTRAVLTATNALGRSVINFMHDDPAAPTIVRGFEVNAGSTVTTGIGINWPHAEQSLTGAIKRIENCLVHDVNSLSAQGEYEYGIVVSSGYGGGRTVSNVEVINCTTYNISRGGINIYSANDDPLSRITAVLVRGNEVYATGQDPDYAGSALPMKNHVLDAVLEYNHVHDTTRGAGISLSSHTEDFRGPQNAVIRHNIVQNCAQMGLLFNVKGSVSADIYGNLIRENVYQGIRFMDVGGDVSLRIYNNTLIHNYEPTWSHEILIHTGTANVVLLEVKNNLLLARPETLPIQDEEGSITDHAHNLYYRTSGGALARAEGVNYTEADLQTWEPTALSAEPLLVDISNPPTGFIGTLGADLRPNTDGLNLTETSPARNSGVALAADYDTSINSIPRPSGTNWDIGAYEYNEGTAQPDAGIAADAEPDAEPDPDGGSDGGVDSGADGGTGGSSKSGCSCRTQGGNPSSIMMILVVLLVVETTRRKASRRVRNSKQVLALWPLTRIFGSCRSTTPESWRRWEPPVAGPSPPCLSKPRASASVRCR